MTESTPASAAAEPPQAAAVDLLALPATVGTALVARRLLADVVERRTGLADDGHPEALHDFRVSVRRLRSWLHAFQPELRQAVRRKKARRLRSVARRSNESRDAEVQIAWLVEQASVLPDDVRRSLDWLLERVRSGKQRSDARFRKRLVQTFDKTCAALDDALTATADRTTVRRSVGVGSQPLSNVVASMIRVQTERLQLHFASLHSVNDDTVAHRARIASKRLRYALEPIADEIPGAGAAIAQLKGLQDALGEFHDAHVLVDAVADSIATAAADRTERIVSAVRAVGAEPLANHAHPDLELGLLKLAERVHERVIHAFESLRDAWLGDRADALIAETGLLATALESLSFSESPRRRESERL